MINTPIVPIILFKAIVQIPLGDPSAVPQILHTEYHNLHKTDIFPQCHCAQEQGLLLDEGVDHFLGVQ